MQGFCFRENLVSGIGQQENPSHSGVTQGAGPRELWCRDTKAAWGLRGRTSGGAGTHTSVQLVVQNRCMLLLLKLRSHGAVVVGWEVGEESRFLTSCGLAPPCASCAIWSPARCRCHQPLSASPVGGLGVHSHMGPLCFEEHSKCKPRSFPGHTVKKGKKRNAYSKEEQTRDLCGCHC